MGKIAITERVTGHTELIGLIAYPIRHSMSPTMHNEAFKKLGLDYVYVCFEVDNSTLEDTVKGLRAMKVRGWNVSMPNKGPITQYLDKLALAILSLTTTASSRARLQTASALCRL